MRGRKPTPTVLKLIQGNPGKRALNKHEPKPTSGCEKPAFLKARAAEIWAEYAPMLERIGVLTCVDGHMFAAWCSLAAEFERAPMIPARIAQLRALAASFGLEPSARARLSVNPVEAASDDPAERFFT